MPSTRIWRIWRLTRGTWRRCVSVNDAAGLHPCIEHCGCGWVEWLSGQPVQLIAACSGTRTLCACARCSARIDPYGVGLQYHGGRGGRRQRCRWRCAHLPRQTRHRGATIGSTHTTSLRSLSKLQSHRSSCASPMRTLRTSGWVTNGRTPSFAVRAMRAKKPCKYT